MYHNNLIEVKKELNKRVTNYFNKNLSYTDIINNINIDVEDKYNKDLEILSKMDIDILTHTKELLIKLKKRLIKF